MSEIFHLEEETNDLRKIIENTLDQDQLHMILKTLQHSESDNIIHNNKLYMNKEIDKLISQ
jgi:hypothetical protein